MHASRSSRTPCRWKAAAAVAAFYGIEPEVFPEGMVRVTDRNRLPIAIATLQPAERERPVAAEGEALKRKVATNPR